MNNNFLQDIFNVINSFSTDGLLELSHLDECLLEINALESLQVSNNNCTVLRNVLHLICKAFDRSESNVVDLSELMCGLSVLFNCEANVKLSFNFNLMDDDSDGYLTKRGLWKIFRALLISSLCLSRNNDFSPMKFTDLCDLYAVGLAGDVLHYQSRLQDTNVMKISFEELLEWDHSCELSYFWGLQLFNRLNTSASPLSILLDKYTVVDFQEESLKRIITVGLTDFEVSNKMIFSCNLLGSIGSGSKMELTLSRYDAVFIQGLANITGLALLQPQIVANKIVSLSLDGKYLSRQRFEDFILSQIKLTTGKVVLDVLTAFMNIFEWYVADENGDSMAPVNGIVTVLSIFCQGSKSSKLSACFHFFSGFGDGSLDEYELSLFLEQYLKLLFAISRLSTLYSGFLPITKARASISITCSELAKEICRKYHKNVSDDIHQRIDFLGFGDWYNGGGFLVLPWLELIDLRKWTGIETPNPEKRLPSTSPSLALESKVDKQLTNDEASNSNVIHDVSSLHHHHHHHHLDLNYKRCTVKIKCSNKSIRNILISASSCSNIKSLSNDLYFNRYTPDQIMNNLQMIAVEESKKRDAYECNGKNGSLDGDSDGLISWRGFLLFLKMLPTSTKKGSSMRRGHQKHIDCLIRNMTDLRALYRSCQHTNIEVVDADELGCSLSILCLGSKSVKLAAAFDVLDNDGDGLLNRREVWKLFRSLLSGIFALGKASVMQLSADSHLTENDISEVMDSAALFVCNSIFSSTERLEVSFKDIAQWYSDDGFQISPWLELLDINKWHCFIAESEV